MSEPFDYGLQGERTLLAWRRTCLALVVVSAGAVRFTAEALGGLAAVLGLVGVALSAWSYLASAARHGRVHRELTRRGVLPSVGVPALALSWSVVALGASCAAYVLSRASEL